MALKKKRAIIIRDTRLRQIRANLRRLIHSACKAEQMRIHGNKSSLRRNKDFYSNENIQLQMKELNDEYWAIEQPLRDSIIECPVCFKSDKDMTYNPVRKIWYCTDCYEKLRKGNIERGTPEEFP